MKKKKNLDGLDVFKRILKLGDSGALKLSKPVLVFGATPGVVTGVTVGMGGSLVIEYNALTKKEMGGA